MLPYLAIPLLFILLCVTIAFLLNGKWKYSIAFLLLLFLLNYVTKFFPVNFVSSSCGKYHFLKVLCYNVHGSATIYKENQIDIANIIIEESPDVAFLCEFYLSKSKMLDSILTSQGQYLRYYKSKTNCVFYSKYPIDSICPVYTKPKKTTRTLTNRVNVMVGSDTLTIVGCHLSSGRLNFIKSLRDRRIEADTIYNYLKNVQHPVIVMGDMNDVSGSYAINRIKEAELKDAWWEGGCGYGTTFHDGWLHLRIDYILYPNNKLNLQKIKVIDSDLSDHNVLVAEFNVN